MTGTSLVYVLPGGADLTPHVEFALNALRPGIERLVLVVPQGDMGRADAVFAPWSPVRIVPLADGPLSPGAAYKAGLLALWQDPDARGAILLTGAHVAGPMVSPLEAGIVPQQGMFSAYFHAARLDLRLRSNARLDRVACLDFAAVSADLAARPDFRAFWNTYRPAYDPWQDFMALEVRLADWMVRQAQCVCYPAAADSFETADPRHYEVDKVIRAGMPCFPLSVFSLDPLQHDLNGIDLRHALDALRSMNPALYRAVIAHVTQTVPMRDFAAIADQYQVVPGTPQSPGKTEWAFGRIAVFIHAFYADMMPEFQELLARLPCSHDLYLTTSTAAHKTQIETYLAQQGFPADRLDVRVVAQNRGRDMSSLFITFRDVVLSGRYEVALRLHSKRTPQVSRQVGAGFKRHLFDNLAGSPGHVGNILDLFEAQPDIGMVMPPVIHVGFGTLGHSWFNNRQAVKDLARSMGITVPFDPDTPVAAYGTMFWFRPAALHKMFAHQWRWEDYNPEPHHIDGGLAHVQERLIAYVAQGAGYRVVQVMTPELAARYYAKLEYKLQLLAARLMSGNVLHQRDQLDHLGAQGKARLFRRLTAIYGATIQRFPGTRSVLHPVARWVVRVISPKP